MKQEEIKKILEDHEQWLKGEPGGIRADFLEADFENANFQDANLEKALFIGATFRRAYFWCANLQGANLWGADLKGADLWGAGLTGANLQGANLQESNIQYANLTGSDLRSANLESVLWNSYTTFFPLQCPETGSYTAYKKARGKIVQLEIPADALRSSATSRKCRASKAKMLSITELDGTPSDLKSIPSDQDESFVYTIGDTVEVPDFDRDRWKECTAGIHHFITREEAVQY